MTSTLHFHFPGGRLSQSSLLKHRPYYEQRSRTTLREVHLRRLHPGYDRPGYVAGLHYNSPLCQGRTEHIRGEHFGCNLGELGAPVPFVGIPSFRPSRRWIAFHPPTVGYTGTKYGTRMHQALYARHRHILLPEVHPCECVVPSFACIRANYEVSCTGLLQHCGQRYCKPQLKLASCYWKLPQSNSIGSSCVSPWHSLC